MKRLCILLGGHFSNALGGAEYQAGCIADELVSTGEFEVFYLARAIDLACRPSGYQLVQIKGRNRLNRYAFFFDAIDLYRILKEIQPDIIYQRGLLAYTGVAAFYAKKRDCRLVFHVAHDFDVSPFQERFTTVTLLRLIDRKIGEYGIRNADAIIAQTQRQGALLETHFGLEVTAVIGNFHPVPTEKINKQKPIKVIWVGNFKPVKRPEIFVQLASDLRCLHDVEFVMIGNPGDTQRYSDLHRDIKKLENIRFFGLQPLAKVNQQLAQGHLFVNTSLKEGFPNTFIQAWMRKVPVISLDVDLDGLLASKKIGFLSGSYDQLKKDVVCLLTDQELRREMGLNGCKYALENNSPKIFRQILEVLTG